MLDQLGETHLASIASLNRAARDKCLIIVLLHVPANINPLEIFRLRDWAIRTLPSFGLEHLNVFFTNAAITLRALFGLVGKAFTDDALELSLHSIDLSFVNQIFHVRNFFALLA